MRSAPTTMAPILPWLIMAPAMLSEITVVGIPSFISSHAVRREPCRKGRVSSAYTWIFLPCSTAARMTPSAVPYPAVASAPALQCVSTPPALGSGVAPHRLVRCDVFCVHALRFFNQIVLDLRDGPDAYALEFFLHSANRPEQI